MEHGGLSMELIKICRYISARARCTHVDLPPLKSGSAVSTRPAVAFPPWEWDVAPRRRWVSWPTAKEKRDRSGLSAIDWRGELDARHPLSLCGCVPLAGGCALPAGGQMSRDPGVATTGGAAAAGANCGQATGPRDGDGSRSRATPPRHHAAEVAQVKVYARDGGAVA
jgi:hypothetical protein